MNPKISKESQINPETHFDPDIVSLNNALNSNFALNRESRE